MFPHPSLFVHFRLEELQLDRINTAIKREQLQSQLMRLARARDIRAARRGELDAAYRSAQAARGYLTDLIECLDEKVRYRGRLPRVSNVATIFVC